MKSTEKRITALAMALAFVISNAAWASGISVTPIPMTLSPDQPSDLLKVTNEGDSESSFQIQTFLWRQTPDGKIELHPSQEVLAFPEVFTLGSKETRNIRVGVLRASDKTEETYRIIVQELPPPPVPGRAI